MTKTDFVAKKDKTPVQVLALNILNNLSKTGMKELQRNLKSVNKIILLQGDAKLTPKEMLEAVEEAMFYVD